MTNYDNTFLDPEGGSQKATLVVVVLAVGISPPASKNPQDFLNTQRITTEVAYTFVLTLPTDLPSQTYHLFF